MGIARKKINLAAFSVGEQGKAREISAQMTLLYQQKIETMGLSSKALNFFLEQPVELIQVTRILYANFWGLHNKTKSNSGDRN